ncbi:MAG: hypothetical protein HY366_02950 [Candidatus Aenigmarchaeota archaeon]|nr:hypothetical protein [Candidatus Aenigmarchaeota archaeon]
MSFHNIGSAAGFDIADILFKAVLKVPDCTASSRYGCITGNPSHDLIFAFFVPHVVLLLYLFIISRSMHIFQINKALGTLFGLASYITIVYTGWYGRLAALLFWWLGLTIFLTLLYFFLTKIFHPSESEARFKIGEAVGEKISEGREKSKRKSDLQKRKRELEREIPSLETRIRAETNPAIRATLMTELNAVKAELGGVKRELSSI